MFFWGLLLLSKRQISKVITRRGHSACNFITVNRQFFVSKLIGCISTILPVMVHRIAGAGDRDITDGMYVITNHCRTAPWTDVAMVAPIFS
jgi:hypothetical protein